MIPEWTVVGGFYSLTFSGFSAVDFYNLVDYFMPLYLYNIFINYHLFTKTFKAI